MRLAKATLLLSIAVCLFAVAVALLRPTQPASAGYVLPGAPGVVAMMPISENSRLGASGFLLMEDETVWGYDYYASLAPLANPPLYQDATQPGLPVPVSEIRFWSPNGIVTNTGEVWTWDHDYDSNESEWRNLGAPGGVVPTPSGSFGSVKQGF